MARKSLDDILDGNDGPEVIEEQAQPEAEEQPESQPRDETGKFASKGVEPEPQEEPEAVPPTADKLPENVYKPLKAVRDENKALKDQLESLRKEIQANQQPKEPEAPPPSIWEDENAWAQHMGGQLVSQSVQQSVYQSRLQMSEMLMADQVEDFANIKDQLVEYVGSNPALNQQVAESTHPWRTAYQAFKNQQTMQELGATDLETLKAKMREELLAELQAGVPVKPNAPPTLSNKRSVASRSGPAWSGPTSLDELLG